jgi:quercetin dioxygenase-like cupin family protein
MTGTAVRGLVVVTAVGALLASFIVLGRAQAPAPTGFASKELVNNGKVRIQRLTVPAGFREPLQVVPNDQIAIQVTPADLEVTIRGQKTAGRIEPGSTFYVPKNAPHQFLNLGKTPYDVVLVMIK